ncbi:MAG TPA: hypothetical protein VIK73_06145 [Limnochordales bacterium]
MASLFAWAGWGAWQHRVEGQVVVEAPWRQWERRLVLTERRLWEPLAAAGLGAGTVTADRPPFVWPLWRLRIEAVGQASRELWVLTDGGLWDPTRRARVAAKSDARAAAAEAVQLLATGVFGELVPWTSVDPLFSWDSVAVLEDLRTGVRLTVRRYGGYLHADVEPATRHDMAVLRALYAGEWSWRRRPVVAVIAGRRIAASINGMPHGGGVVEDNDFPGHFCLHFLESQVHASRRVDPSHQLMVWQAAGRLAQRMAELPPDQLVTWALAAINEDDEAGLALASAGGDATLVGRLLEEIRYVVGERVEAIGASRPGESPRARIQAVVYYAWPDPGAGFRHSFEVRLVPRGGEPASGGGWAVDLEDLARLLDRPASARPVTTSFTGPEC